MYSMLSSKNNLGRLFFRLENGMRGKVKVLFGNPSTLDFGGVQFSPKVFFTRNESRSEVYHLYPLPSLAGKWSSLARPEALFGTSSILANGFSVTGKSRLIEETSKLFMVFYRYARCFSVILAKLALSLPKERESIAPALSKYSKPVSPQRRKARKERQKAGACYFRSSLNNPCRHDRRSHYREKCDREKP